MATLKSPSLDRLLIETRAMLRQPDNTNTSWTDNDLTLWLNDGINRYFLEVIQYAEGPFQVVAPLDVVNGIDTIPLPSDFYKVVRLYKVVNNSLIQIPYRNNLDSGYDNTPQGSANMSSFSYFLRGNNIVLRPVPGFSEIASLSLEYVGFPDNLIWGGDALNSAISPIFKELIIMYAVYKAKLAESLVLGTDTSSKAAELLSNIETQFKDSVRLRSHYPQFTIPFNP